MPTDTTLVQAIRATLGADDPDLSGQLVLIAEFDRREVATGNTVLFRAATGEYATDPADAEPDEPYHARMSAPEWSQSILEGGDWRTSAALQYSDIELVNMNGELDADVDPAVYEWRGQTVTLLGGLKTWTRAQFVELPAGYQRVVGLVRGHETVRVRSIPEENRLDQPAQRNLYGGFGNQYDFAGTGHTDCGDVCDLGMRDATVTIRFETTATGVDQCLIEKRGTNASAPGTPGFVAWQRTSDDKIVVRIDDGVATAARATNTAWNDGLPHELEISISRTTGLMSLAVDGVEDATPQDISLVTGSLSTTSPLRHGKLASGSLPWQGKLDEPRIYYRALDYEELLNRSKAAVDGQEPGLIAAWPYDENTGTTAYDLVRGPMTVQAGFDGATNCNMGNVANPGTGPFTLCGWSRIDAGNGGILAGKRRADFVVRKGYDVRLLAGDFVFEYSDATTLYSITIAGATFGPFDDSTPWGWLMTYDAVAEELRAWVMPYPRADLIAGTPVSTVGSAFSNNTDNFNLGQFSAGTVPLTGALSWVAYYPQAADEEFARIALSEQAVTLEDSAPTPPPKLSEAALLSDAHFWSLTDNTGTTALDHISAANGTFNKTPVWVDRHGTITPGLSGAWVGTLEGGADLKGLPKPVALGRPQRFKPPWVDIARRILQLSDPSLGDCEEVEGVWDDVTPLTLGVGYTVSADKCFITLAAPPTGEITVSMKGVEQAGRWLRFPGELVAFVWTDMLGIASVNAASVATYDDLHPFESSMWLGPCDRSLECVYNRFLLPDGYAYRNLSNEMALGTRQAPGSKAATLTIEPSDVILDEITEAEVPPPSWLVRCAYGRTVAKISAAAIGDTQGQTLRYVQDRQIEIKERSPEAVIRTYETGVHRRADASLLVQRMLVLDGPQGSGWELPFAVDHWAVDLGDEILFTSAWERYDIQGGRYAVVGYRYGMPGGAPVSTAIIWRNEP